MRTLLNRAARRALATTAMGLAGVCITSRSANAAPINLGAADNYAVFAIDSLQFNGPGVINGNVAVGQSTNFASPAVINGTVFENPSVPAQGNITPTGGFSKISLTAAISDAKAAAATADALTATQTFSSLGNNVTLNGDGGVNVIDVGSNGVVLTNGLLTLHGSASDIFIINDAGKFSFSNSGIVLTGGLTAADVLFNVTGNVALTGGGSANFYGTILAPNSDVSVHDKTLTGALIGNTVEDTSGFMVNDVPFTPTVVPLPRSAWTGLFTLGLLGIAAGLWGRKVKQTA